MDNTLKNDEFDFNLEEKITNGNNSEVTFSEKIFESSYLDLQKLINSGIKDNYSDLILTNNGVFYIDSLKNLYKIDSIKFLEEDILKIFNEINIANSIKKMEFLQNKINELKIGMSFKYKYKDGEGKILEKKVRLRITIIKEIRGLQIHIRLGNKNLLTPDILGIENIYSFFKHKGGLILLTGPTGTGKTTTINSLVEKYIKNNSKHVLIIEDPIEYLYPTDTKGKVTYLEVGESIETFEEGLKIGLRLSPTIIVVGELRDEKTADAILQLALTGHLVITTLHGGDVIQGIKGFINHLGGNKSIEDKLDLLSTALKCIVIQTIVDIKNDNGGKTKIGIREELFVDNHIRAFLKEGKYDKIKETLSDVTGKSKGLNMELLNLMKNGRIGFDGVVEYTNDLDGLIEILKKNKQIYEEHIDYKKIIEFINNND